MIVAAYLRLSGFFGLVTTWAMRRAGTPVGALAAVVVAAGTLSALFVNDVICVVMAPLVVDLTRRLGLPPVPYLIALLTAANVGSVATLTGNPQNMLIGSFSAISYRAFLLREAPVALVGLGCVFVVVWLVYRRQLPPALGAAAVEPPVTVHYPLMIKTVVAVLVMLAAFPGGVPVAIVAFAGAAATLLTRRVNPNKVYREIDWRLLVLFTGLFVLTGGAERTGLADAITTSPLAAGLERPAVLTAVLSNLVSNVPAVLVFKPIVPQLAEPTRAWLLVAMASTLSGNLTILASAGCSSDHTATASPQKGAPPAIKPRDVRVVPAKELKVVRTVSVNGTLNAEEQVVLSLKVTGRLANLAVDLGSRVHRGQVIARLEPVDFNLRVDQAQAALHQARARLGLMPDGTDDRVAVERTAVVRQAKAQLDDAVLTRERTEKLSQQDLVARAQLDTAVAAEQVAEARYHDALEEARNRQAILAQRRSELDMARQALTDTVLLAPADGIIRERRAGVGEYLIAGPPVATL